MARFARFGRAWGEFASQIKVNPLVTAWKGQGGIKNGFSALGTSLKEPYFNMAQEAIARNAHLMKPVDGVVSPLNQLKFGANVAAGTIGQDLSLIHI